MKNYQGSQEGKLAKLSTNLAPQPEQTLSGGGFRKSPEKPNQPLSNTS